jgi:putative tryptophan/tyrosine transport system substrate-binding protein
VHETQEAARILGLEVTLADIRRAEDIEPAFVALRGRAGALYVCSDTLTNLARVQIATSALSARLPSIFAHPAFATVGGLMSYGANPVNLYRRAADLVDKILRGTKPADIPVEQPTTHQLIVNLKTAKALGLTIPETLLATADEVIQ